MVGGRSCKLGLRLRLDQEAEELSPIDHREKLVNFFSKSIATCQEQVHGE